MYSGCETRETMKSATGRPSDSSAFMYTARSAAVMAMPAGGTGGAIVRAALNHMRARSSVCMTPRPASMTRQSSKRMRPPTRCLPYVASVDLATTQMSAYVLQKQEKRHY
jgi:hypothetical protein